MELTWLEWTVGIAAAVFGIVRGIIYPNMYRIQAKHAIVSGGIIGIFVTLITAFFAGRWISNR